MNYEPMNREPVNYYEDAWQAQETLGEYTAKTYLWMFLGLLVTFGIGLSGYLSGAVLYAFRIPGAIPVLTGLELITVLVLSWKINTLSVGMARFLFLLYSAMNGVVFSVYFLMFGVGGMMFVFAATAVFFGTMAVVSKVFNIDVSGLRPLMFGGLILLIVFGIASMFINLGAFEVVLCYAGIIIFLLFTAYDTRKISALYRAYSGSPEMLAKSSVISALQLYLDFVNLFIYILRLMNTRRR
ncbi:MAG: Bax inhibitor-1/YccA family protein [Clostridium sp.]|nr:Bax inhibitor-1/YccA family protein [Clostridium sp.]